MVNYNQTYHAFFYNNANEITGAIDKQYNGIENYFHLKISNERLIAQNARLQKLLFAEYNGADTSYIEKKDTLLLDSTTQVLKYDILPAKVVDNNVNDENNYLTLERGSKQAVSKDMGVSGPDGIVGRVILVSENYCRVMSLLNHNSKVSATLKRGLYNGIIDWDGKEANPAILLMHNISKSAQVKRGDTVVTSSLSGSFPPNLMVGTVTEIDLDPSSNFYTLKLKASTNFYNLQYAYLIKNNMLEEQQKLENQTP